MAAQKRHNQTLVEFVMRRYKFWADQFGPDDVAKLRNGDIDRAGGDVLCEHCGLKYLDHPGIENYPGLCVTCNWEIYKL